MADTPSLAPRNEVDAMLDKEAPLDASQQKKAPVEKSYKVYPQSRIAVSKKAGPLWKSRKAAGWRAIETFVDAWNEAVKYYNNDQFGHRVSPNDDRPGNTGNAREMTDEFSETENLVFSNINSMMPSLYAKNPTIEFTGPAQFEALLEHLEKLMKVLMHRTASPGLNLKPKARRHVLRALLMNMSYLEIGYNDRLGSPEEAMAELAEATEQLKKATDSEIKDIEGRLMAIESETSILFPPGPWMRTVDPRLVIRDPQAEEEDLSDANYLMVGEYFPTDWLRARFTEKHGELGTVLIFEPTHVVALGKEGGSGDAQSSSGVEEEANNFTLLGKTDTYKTHGYKDESSYRSQCHTLVWKVYDKATRRVMWFLDNDWSWPLWVWDDPNKLTEFFPVYALAFHQNPEGPLANGETSYYLDQQDAINAINSQRNKEINDVRTKLFYNKQLGEEVVEEFLSNKIKRAVGLDIPEGTKLDDHFYTPTPKSIQFQQLFDKNPLYAAINRISSVNDVMRGGEFKTNTTNMAIETYNSSAASRNDEKIDQIEDCLSRAMWGIAQLCLQKMSKDQVSVLIGEEATDWINIDAQTLRYGFSPQVVAGSTTKPTSAHKKAQALEVGQVLGQFAGKDPRTVATMTSIVLRMFSRAFDEVSITKAEWDTLIMQTEAGGPLGMVDQLPPPAKMAFATAVSQGVPAQQALDMIMQAMGQSGGAKQTNGPPASATQ